MPRTSPRRQAALQATKQSQDEEDTASSSPLKDGQNGNPKKSKTVKGSSSNNKKKSPPAKEKTTQASAGGTKRKQTAAKKNQEPPEKKKTKAEPQRLTERDELPKLWTPEQAQKHGSYTFKIASWNVAGLRALMRNHPEALAKLAKEHDLDVLCLQETKLQEAHLDDPKLKIRGHLLEQEGYDAYYTCSTTKKGYSGTACFVRRRNEGGGEAKTGANTTNGKQKNIGDFFGKKTTTTSAADDKLEAALLPIDENLLVPTEVTYSFGKSNHDGEGRIICLDFPLFTLIALYVPNSGQKLERLDYRTKEWDMDLVQFVKEKQATRNVPVMWLGDLVSYV